MSNSVIHHYDAPAYPKPSEYKIYHPCRILSAMLRNGQPAVYVQKETSRTLSDPVTLKCFVIGTGQDFDPGNCTFIGTVTEMGYFWHVWAVMVP